MKKRLISIALALCLALSLAAPTLAASQTTTELDTLSDQEIVDLYYDKHTITFDTIQSTAVTFSDEVSTSSVDKDHAIHLKNVAAAKEFVLSLDLENHGMSLVEEACLRELKAYEETDDIVLESYTVLTPKTITRATPSGLSLLGSKNGRSFYYNLTAQASYGAKKNTNKNLSTLQNWVNGVVDIVLTFAPKKYTIPYTVFKSILGTPSNWTVAYGSYVENYMRVNPTTRNIYTQIGTNQWRCLLSNQTGTADPTTIFYCMNRGYDGVYTKTHGSQNVSTPNYNNTSLMINMAYSQWQSSAYGNDPFTQTLLQNLNNLNVSWQ